MGNPNVARLFIEGLQQIGSSAHLDPHQWNRGKDQNLRAGPRAVERGR